VTKHGAVGRSMLAVVAVAVLLPGPRSIVAGGRQANKSQAAGKTQPAALAPPAAEARPILTPKPPASPRINGPRVYGARPGHDVIYRIPATGMRPMQFAARGLPASLSLDSSTGIISGRAPEQPGRFPVTLHAVNKSGAASRALDIVVGETLALTPPMGWNDWYTHYDRITDALLRQAADAMIASGMADYGYQFVNIDDCWMTKADSKDPVVGGPARDADGNIRPNGRFPDMKALTDYIHAKGLKAGIYTSPGPYTCAGFTGSYKHEAQDLQQFARWGFDFLKYDWCSYEGVSGGKDLADRRRPYELMGGLVAKADRDITFNLCQYGMSDVWTWGGEVGGHCWRTTGDLGLEKAAKLPGFYSIAFKNAEHAEFAGPGRWNDPDYILIGSVGNAFNSDEPQKPTSLTADEQYSYMSLWALMAAPLFFSGDMNHLDAFTLNVLCNHEVIDVDQDPLGRQARIVRRTDDEFVLARPLEDGSLALGIFNLADRPRRVSVTWRDLGVTRPQRVRDVWRQRDVTAAAANTPAGAVRTGAAAADYSALVAGHGVSFVRLFPAGK
jgi:alpha-galactosidase